jgi:hypothetical protein
VSASSPGSVEIRDYLLRRMPDTERSRFEAAYFSDDALLDRIEAEEDALVSDYVLGRLSDGERRLFEESLLGTPYYRERVETTRGLRLKVAAPGLFPQRPIASAGDGRLFPGRSGVGIGFGLLALLLVAALLSALRLKSDLTRARLELAARPARTADPAAQAGVAPLVQSVILGESYSAGPSLTRLRRPPGGAVLLGFPRSLLGHGHTAWAIALSDGKRVAWESGAFPSKDIEEGAPSLRLPPEVPPAGAYAVLLRTPGVQDRAEILLGVLEILDR